MLAPNQLVHPIVRVQQVAGRLVGRRFGGREGERNRLRIAMFHVEHSATRRRLRSRSTSARACGGVPVFSRPHRNPRDFDGFGQISRRRLISTAGWTLIAADVNQAIQKGPGGDHQRLAAETAAVFELEAANLAAIRAESARRGRESTECSARPRARRAPTCRIAACPPGRAATTPPARGCD